MSNERRYGNDHYWAFLEIVPSGREVAIYQAIDGEENAPRIVARATSKYDATMIIDSLISYKNTSQPSLLKKEILFLEFVKANCPEPYSTMAANAILWNDKEAYNKLRMDFPVIYS